MRRYLIVFILALGFASHGDQVDQKLVEEMAEHYGLVKEGLEDGIRRAIILASKQLSAEEVSELAKTNSLVSGPMYQLDIDKASVELERFLSRGGDYSELSRYHPQAYIDEIKKAVVSLAGLSRTLIEKQLDSVKVYKKDTLNGGLSVSSYNEIRTFTPEGIRLTTNNIIRSASEEASRGIVESRALLRKLSKVAKIGKRSVKSILPQLAMILAVTNGYHNFKATGSYLEAAYAIADEAFIISPRTVYDGLFFSRTEAEANRLRHVGRPGIAK